MRTGIFATIAASALLIGSVSAQTTGQRIIVESGGGSPRNEGAVRVQSSINFFMAGPTGESDEAQKLRERARKIIYEMAARECDLLRETLAKDCRLESVTSNINRQFSPSQQEGFSINGAMAMHITLK